MAGNQNHNLTQRVAEALGPQGVWAELHPHVPSLEQPHNGKVEVRALCAFHEDRHPSWCWNLAKGIAMCHVCDQGTSFVRYIATATNRAPVDVLDDYCKRLGLPRPRKRTLTLMDYAAAKRLPLDFLQERFALEDGLDGLRIPYLSNGGEILAVRRRRRLCERPRWVGRGTPARKMVYGAHGADWLGMTGYGFAVEGESDLHTAWFHDLPALATPGASVGHKALAEVVADLSLHTLYALPDADHAGKQWLFHLDAAFKMAGWSGKLFVVRLPTKDLSDLHCKSPETFPKAVWACLNQALPAAEVLLGYENQQAMEDKTMIRLFDRIMATPGANPTDRIIALMAARQVAPDPSQPLTISKSKLAKLARIERKTLYNRLPELKRLGLLESNDGLLRLGRSLV